MVVAMPAAAQTSYGSVVGTVTDASSSNIPGAAVALINLGTAERRSTLTDVSGNYQVVNLVPGNYRLEIEKSGFKHLTRVSVRVESQHAHRIDANIEGRR